ncbi:hypothetical protein WJ12_17530 [Burkholderia seminalis]|nr:hypothetical protein WJ12_17530 [Burkholderia seminalis]KVF42332.1 hypothetical protein WJ13_01900 [Burkholderia seminalis]
MSRYHLPERTWKRSRTTRFSSGRHGHFHFDGDAFHLFARVLTTHDLQLEVAPVKVIDEVAKRLERYCRAT